MKKYMFALALGLVALGACAAQESGIRDASRFPAQAERTAITSAKPADALVQCFREKARLYPGASILPNAAGGFDYDLTVAGYIFERIEFRSSESGSTATLLLAPGVNARWRSDMERERIAPLRACAG